MVTGNQKRTNNLLGVNKIETNTNIAVSIVNLYFIQK